MTRKKGESIVINDNIEIIILSSQGEQVKIGIVAPKEVSIYRKEVYEQIKDENREASEHINISAVKNLIK